MSDIQTIIEISSGCPDAAHRHALASRLAVVYDSEPFELLAGLADMLCKLEAHKWCVDSIQEFCESVIKSYHHVKEVSDEA